MKRSHGFLITSLLVFSFFMATSVFPFDQGGLADRLNEKVTEELVSPEIVAGKTFFGEFTNSCGDTATSCMAFDERGNIDWDQDFEGNPFVFSGTYDENAFGRISLWAATLLDGSPNREFSLAGVAVGPFLFLRLSNRDESCPDETSVTAKGMYRLIPCTPGQRPNASSSSGENVIVVNAWAQEIINFEGIAEGTIVSSVLGDRGSSVGVFGTNPTLGASNAAMIYDSSCFPSGGIPRNCSGDDDDLGTPNEDFFGPGVGLGGQSGSSFENNTALGNLLIVSEDLDSNDPDDADVVGAEIEFDFSGVGSGSATVSEITIIDVEGSATVDLFDESLILLDSFILPQTGDNGVAVVSLGPTPGVVTMVVTLNGSGAIDNVVFTPDDDNEGCTPGYWKQPHHFDSWVNYMPDNKFSDVFGRVIEVKLEKRINGKGQIVHVEDPTLDQALKAKGGKINALARHGVAALLNAATADVNYEYSELEVIKMFQDAYDSGDYEPTKDMFEMANESFCPLD